MEPAAPGTEDDVPATPMLNKQASENERLLNLKAILPNGKYENVFELSYLFGAEHWFCRACRCPVMGRVYQHEQGKRHCLNMAMTQRHMEKYEKQAEVEEPPAIEVAPGEPLPPGFEGQVEETAQIQERLDNFKVGPLVALEYLVEMQQYDQTKEPFYLCILCDKKGDPRTVLTHLSSYNHISQYLQKHFPSCYRKLAPYMTKQYKRSWQRVLVNIAEAIEQKFGRLKPLPIDKDKFEADRFHYLSIICKGKHFSEKSGYTFEDLIQHDELTKVYYDVEPSMESQSTIAAGQVSITKPFKKRSPSPPVVARPVKKSKQPATQQQVGQSAPNKRAGVAQGGSQSVGGLGRRRSLSSVSSISSSDMSDHESDKKLPFKKAPPPQLRRNVVPPPKQQPRYVRNEKGMLPWEKANYKRREDNSLSRNSQNDRQRDNRNEKLDEYKKLAKAIENDMNKTLTHHEKNPEKHPQYNDEWKKFWNKRYKELQAEGKDAANFDFKPEWIKYWNKRMIELHQEEIKNRKDALRKRLGLPDEPAPISFRITGRSNSAKDSPKNTRPLPTAAQPDQDNEVIIIDDKDDDKSRKSKVEKYGRSQSPWEDEEPPSKREKSKDRHVRDSPIFKRSRSRERYMMRSRSRERSSRRSRSKSTDRRSWRSRSRERSDKREYRESSFERDLRGRERVRTVADLPWERDRYRTMDYYGAAPAIMRDVTRNPVLHPSVMPRNPMVLPPPIIEDDDNDEVNLVSVLRLLTALEERLGSLGPKVIDLLAQALALEKNEANSSETLLDNDVNCVLFETVKEKLKGQLLAGLVDMMQERAFKIAIKKTANLIHEAGQRKKKQTKPNTRETPVEVPGVGTVDKAAIARQIANALVAQNKTDVTQDQLEQLINAVVGMAEASQKSGKPISTASFLEKLSGGGGVSSSSESTRDVPKVEPKEVKPEVKLERLTEPLTPSPKSSSYNMEHLSDSDLQTLLQNFKDLSTEEQHGLINYLKKLESHEPERVERLRKFVNLTGSNNSEKEKPKVEQPKEEAEEIEDDFDDDQKPFEGRESPFSNRMGSVNPSVDDINKKEPAKIHIDSEDEEYSFEDVVKAASNNVKAKELEKERKIVEESMKKTKEVELVDAKSIISNLMSNFNKGKQEDMLGLGSNTVPTSSHTFQSPVDFNSLSNINLDNIANIVGNAHKLMQNKRNEEFREDFPPVSEPEKLNFEPPPHLQPQSNAGSGGGKATVLQNIVLNRIDRSGPMIRPNLGPSRPNFEPPRPDLMPINNSRPDGSTWVNTGPRTVQGPNQMMRPQQNPSGGFGSGHQMGMNRGNNNMGQQPRLNNPFNKNLNNPYNASNFPQNNYQPQQQNVSYPNVRGGAPFDQRPARFNNPRFGGNQYNPRPSGNYNNNRW